jgi:hypothetical protein
MVQFLEMYSNDDDDDDDDDEDDDKDDDEDDDEDDDNNDDDDDCDGDGDDVDIRKSASAYSSPICTPDYNNNNDASSSSNHSTVGDSIGVGNNNEYEVNDDDTKDANHEDNDDDANDCHDPFSYFPSSDKSLSSYQSSICDGTHSDEDYNNDDSNDYSFVYASSSPCAAMRNNHNAVLGNSNAINVSDNCNAVSGSDDDIMLSSLTNQSLQPNVSASDSSSFISPRCDPECNTHLKVKNYDVGEDSSDEWPSSNERVSSAVRGSASIPPKPHSFKPTTKSSFDVIRQPKLVSQ